LADILIRDIPDDVVAAIDAGAQRAGLSRVEFVRRALARESRKPIEVTVADLEGFATVFGDLGDDEVMEGAWS
jgi:Ribbon-helix-helix protein, copG family